MTTKYEESQQPDNTPSNQTRRSALKKMLVGTGVAASAAALPGKWAKPMVDKVLVPAHAQTSTTTTTTTTTAAPLTCGQEGYPVPVTLIGTSPCTTLAGLNTQGMWDGALALTITNITNSGIRIGMTVHVCGEEEANDGSQVILHPMQTFTIFGTHDHSHIHALTVAANCDGT